MSPNPSPQAHLSPPMFSLILSTVAAAFTILRALQTWTKEYMASRRHKAKGLRRITKCHLSLGSGHVDVTTGREDAND